MREKSKHQSNNPKINLLIDIQEKIINKDASYERWAINFNLKSMSETLLFLRAHNVTSIEELRDKTNEATEKFNALSDGTKGKEVRMAELLALKKHIFNYSDTREIYIQYRKSGYTKNFYEAHREQITLHKAAKQAFNESGLKKTPTVKELNKQYHELMSEKKQMYSDYYKLKNEMQQFMKVQKNA